MPLDVIPANRTRESRWAREIFESSMSVRVESVNYFQRKMKDADFTSQRKLMSDSSDQSPLIFLCHAKEDRAPVKRLYEDLKQAGFNPWLDEVDILPGHDWDFEIKRAMKSTNFTLICLSKFSVRKRGYLNKEIKWALDRQDEMPEGDIFLIPVKLEECDLPYRLEKIQAVDLFMPDGFEKLVNALKYQLARVMETLADDITQKPTGPNPFYYGGAVPTELFYGREDILKAIMTRIGGPGLQSISIVGERRMGKSSLLSYVKNTFQERLPRENNYLIIYLDLMKGYCHTRKGLMRALRRKLTKMWREPWSETEDGDIGAFDFAIEDLRDDDIRLILCLDEVENLTRRPAEFDDLLEDWRACGSMGQMAMITASSHPLADLCKAGDLSSPFFNIFSQKQLGLLEGEEWKALVKDHMQTSEEELRLIEETAGGHPLFTQIAASAIWEMKAGGRVDHARLKVDVEGEISPHLHYLWKKLPDHGKAALNSMVGISRDKPDDSIVYSLTARGILRNNRPFCRPFADFIKKVEK